MKIYGIDNSELLDVKTTSSARHEEEMMKSDFVRLSWKGNVKQTLGVGSYIVPFGDGLKYRLTEPYIPEQDAEDTFTYQPEFQHPLAWLGKVPFTYATKDTLGEDVVQQEWEYTGLTSTLLQYAADFINTAFGFTAESDKFSPSMTGDVDTSVSVSFSSTDVLSALTSIANACSANKCEWHLSWKYRKLYFGQVSVNYGETVPTLKVGVNVGKAGVSGGGDGYYNVFFPQGSTRNMSAKAASGENVSTGIRLGLDKTKYADGMIDTRTNANEPKQTLALTFDDVYPHVDCYAYNVRHRTRYLLDDNNEKVVSSYNSDGSVKEYKKYTVWYMRLAYPVTSEISGKTKVATTTETVGGKTQTLYWYDYVVEDSQILDGYTLCGSFSVNTNEGALASSLVAQPSGSDGFELRFHKAAETIPADAATGDSGVSVLAGDFEIVFVNQDDTIIPTNESEGLIPRGESEPSTKCNIVVLYNIAMGDEEVAAAQDELEQKTRAEIAYRQSDLNNYTFNAYPQVWAKNNPKLYIGQRVVYDDGNGYSYTTRVMKLVTNIDYDIVQEITVGNAAVKGTVSQLKEDVQTIMSGNWSGGGGLNTNEVLAIIRNYVTPRFLSKQSADTAQGLITFKSGLAVGGAWGIGKDGDATLLSAMGDDGTGVSRWRIYPNGKAEFRGSLDAGGNATVGGTLGVTGAATTHGVSNGGDISNTGLVTTKDLNVTGSATFHELVMDKIRSTGGSRISSAADGFRIERAEEAYGSDGSTVEGYKLYWLASKDGKATQNMWKKGDQAISMNFNLATPGTTLTAAGNKLWWALVTDASGETPATLADDDGEERQYHWIEVSATVKMDGCTVSPEAGDEVAMLGSRATDDDGSADTARQSAIYESSYTSIDAGYTKADGTVVAPLEAPFWAQYRGIDDFELPKHRKTYFDATGGHVVGDFYNESDGQSLVELINETQKGAKVYVHVAYAKDATGAAGTWLRASAYEGLADDARKEYRYIGFCPNYAEDDSGLEHGSYTWSYTGKDGESGKTPYIGDNGDWYINGVDQNVKAQGDAGKDGADALRNLLVGSGLDTASGVYSILENDSDTADNTAEVDTSTQCLGTNSLHVKTAADGYPTGGSFTGIYFRPVAVKRSTKYTASVWAKGTGALWMEAVNLSGGGTYDHDKRDGGLATSGRNAAGDGWTPLTFQFTTDGTHDWLEMNFWANEAGCDLRLSRFMLEEGDYKGWTLNEADLKGERGDDGTSVTKTGQTVEYQRSASGTKIPTGDWETAPPDYNIYTPWLWTRTTVTFSSGDPVVSYSVARQGKDGETPSVSISSGGNWVINGTDTGKQAAGDDGHSPKIGDDGCWWEWDNTANGYASTGIKAQGEKGDSITIVKTETAYQISSSGTEAPTGGWAVPANGDAMPEATDEKPWLWTRVTVSYSDGASAMSYSVGYKGKDGKSVAGAAAVQYRLLPVEGNVFTTQDIAAKIDGDSGSLTATTKVLLSLAYTLMRQEGEAYEPQHDLTGFTLSAAYGGGTGNTNLTVAKDGNAWKVGDTATEYDAQSGPDSVTVTLTRDSDGEVCDRRVVPLTLRASHLFAVTDAGLAAAFNKSTADAKGVQGNLDKVQASLQSQITANAESIETKVEQSDYDTLSGQVSRNTTDIRQNSDNITAQAATVSDNTTRIGKLEVSGDRISLKVDRISTPPKNLLAMSSVGERAVTGKYLVTDTYSLAASKGKTYTITWRGRVENAAAYMTICVYNSGWSFSAHASWNDTASGTHRMKFTATADETLSWNGRYTKTDGMADPKDYPYKIYTDWIRVDEGDWTSENGGLGLLDEWEPADADLEAVNLLPDHLLATDIAKAVDEANVGTREKVADGSNLSVATGAEDGVPYIRLTRSGYTGTAYGGVKWYVPFRGAGDYTLSLSARDMRPSSFTPDSDNMIYVHLRPCDADKKILSNHAQAYLAAGGPDYGWAHVASPSDKLHFDDEMEATAAGELTAGTKYKVAWLQVHLFMQGNGDMAVSRLCLSKCSHATLWNAQELSGERKDEARQLATGIDIYNKRIVATGDTFEWRGNDGGAIAEFSAGNGATFHGNVSAETFSTNNGGMTVGEDGVLHATGAEIEGTVGTSNGVQRATLSGGGMQITDSAGSIVTEHTGLTHETLADALGGTSASFGTTSGSAEVSTGVMLIGGKTVSGTVVASQQATATGYVKLSLSGVSLRLLFASYDSRKGTTITGRVGLWLTDDTAGTRRAIYSKQGGVTGDRGTQAISTSDCPGTVSLPVRAGHYYSVTLECSVGTNSGATYPGGYSATAGARVTDMEFDNDTWKSEFFGNGLLLSKGLQNYLAAMLVDGNMLFEARSGSHGLRLASGGMYRTADGSNWHRQPLTLFAIKVGVSSSGASIVANNSGAELGVSRQGAGWARITFPSWWADAYKPGTNGVAQVTPVRGSSGNYWLARVYALTDTWLDVVCSDDDTGNDGGTMFVELKVY